MSIERLQKCLLSLLAEIEKSEFSNGKDLVDRCEHTQYEYEITPYYAILRNDAPPGTVFTDTIAVQLFKLQSHVPLALEIHLVAGRIGELELYMMDGSQIKYEDYWESDCGVSPGIVCRLLDT